MANKMKQSVQMFKDARQTISGIAKTKAWWPSSQAERSVLAQAIAMEWANRANIGSTQGNETWVSTCWGRAVELQRAMFHHYKVILPPPGAVHASGGLRRLSAMQFLVDFSIWPTDNAKTSKLVHLTMESEMYSEHSVKPEVHSENGYAYDFYKIVWCKSPRRLFACCVRWDSERDKLQKSLTKVAKESASFIGSDELRVFMLSPGRKQSGDSRVGVWNGKAFDWDKVGDPAL